MQKKSQTLAHTNEVLQFAIALTPTSGWWCGNTPNHTRASPITTPLQNTLLINIKF